MSKKNGKGWRMNQSEKTPDGREKCFAYNLGRPCAGNCGRVHTCIVCNGAHARCNCPRKPKGDAAGSAVRFQ